MSPVPITNISECSYLSSRFKSNQEKNNREALFQERVHQTFEKQPKNNVHLSFSSRGRDLQGLHPSGARAS